MDTNEKVQKRPTYRTILKHRVAMLRKELRRSKQTLKLQDLAVKLAIEVEELNKRIG